MRNVMTAALAGLALLGFASSASASTDLTWPPKDVKPVHKTKAELQKQADGFSAHQKKAFPRAFPGATNVVPGNWGGEAEGVFDDMQYMGNSVTFTYQGQKVNTFTQVNAPGFLKQSPKEFCETTTCTGTVSDHRGGVTVFEKLDQWGIVAARNWRPNGEVVWVQSWTAGTEKQLAKLAEDRAFTFTK